MSAEDSNKNRAPRLKRFTVHLLSPYMTWDGVPGKDEAEAIAACEFPPEADLADGPYRFVAEEEDIEEPEDESDQLCESCGDADCSRPFPHPVEEAD